MTGPTQPTFHLEIETKLEVDADAVLPDPLRSKAVRKSGLVTAAPPVTHTLDATYYDTERLDLLRSKVTLRRRTGGDDAGWHLKLPGGAAAAGARTEVQLPLGRSGGVPAELAELVRGTARGRELKPVARLQNTRTVIRLLDSDGAEAVEIADDLVTATRPGDDRVDRWREVEVELINGDADQLAATVTALTDAGARPAGRASKLARALPLPAVAGPKPKSAAAAIVGALTRHRDKLITTDRALRQRTTDAVHDARAAARRIRSVLRVYEALFTGESVDSVRDRLRELGQALGVARDLDVVGTRVAAGLTEEPEEFGRASGALIRAELERRSAAALELLQVHIDSPEYLQLLRDLDEFLVHPPLTRRGNRAAAAELPLQLGRAWRRLRALADAALADPDNSHAVHAVRKAAKTVRYAAESTIGVLGDDAVLFAAALEEVQEVLGEYQDAQITARMLVEVAAGPDTDGIAGFTFGRLHAMEQAIAAGAIEDFADAWDRVDDADLAIALGQD
ncbi:CYTH and CHAD domain-containing protein [Nakamurella lactea]|uniref:CYTH and CHAD domain-containing protein n=1 Tax=Nakamurella lactea TaxID=459515 RepID=UPI0004172323|nr:CYTH and CHAD domain-containing protein [Nakamurella lactea]